MYIFVEKKYFKLNMLYMEVGNVTIRYGGCLFWDWLLNISRTAFQRFLPGGKCPF